jgi:D-lyxose isomerase
MSRRCIIGEVSTANDDLHDNFFVNPEVGRYPGIQEDEPPIYARSQPERLRSDQSHELWRDAASDSSARWQSPKIPQCAHFTTRFLCLRSLRVTIRGTDGPEGSGADPSGRGAEILEFEVCDQYTIQGDAFSTSIRQGTELPVPLEGSVRNMAVIKAIFRSTNLANGRSPLASGLGGCPQINCTHEVGNRPSSCCQSAADGLSPHPGGSF